MVPKSFGAISPAFPPQRQLLDSYTTISITERTSSSSTVLGPFTGTLGSLVRFLWATDFFDFVPF
jgi:hypothetical protein